MHSHFLPGLDDGAKSFEDSLAMIREMISFGYEKLITTPHVISDAYRNSPETILPKLEQLRSHLADNQVTIEIGAAAEYESLMNKIASNEPLLTFGK